MGIRASEKGPLPRGRVLKVLLASLLLSCLALQPLYGAGKLSPASEECIDCHSTVTPGIVDDWQRSRHARFSPQDAVKVPGLKRRFSAQRPPEGMEDHVVGCAECHTLDPELHKDTFDHNGYRVHIVVTPRDCARCHPKEVAEYDQNLMSKAHGNLVANPLYQMLVEAVDGLQIPVGEDLVLLGPDELTRADSCLFCHGTKVEVGSFELRETEFGEMAFPVLYGWPNQGTGRVNPDGSLGACSSCHSRHRFSIAEARKPYTCGGCHKGPDVPAYKVYMVSRHGTIFSSEGDEWDFEAVPWRVGRHFSTPTCAACHMGLLVDEGGVMVQRTHRMNDRLAWRIFGLIYAHPHPKDPDTSIMRNRGGLPLPTELTGEPAKPYLIDEQEQARRQGTMEKVCSACHSRNWVRGHFARLQRAIETTNEMTLTATKLLLRAWQEGVAKGLEEKDSIFNEAIERKWVRQWLFYANSVRFASAMAGADYGVFANGRWSMGENIQEMADWLQFKSSAKGR